MNNSERDVYELEDATTPPQAAHQNISTRVLDTSVPFHNLGPSDSDNSTDKHDNATKSNTDLKDTPNTSTVMILQERHNSTTSAPKIASDLAANLSTTSLSSPPNPLPDTVMIQSNKNSDTTYNTSETAVVATDNDKNNNSTLPNSTLQNILVGTTDQPPSLGTTDDSEMATSSSTNLPKGGTRFDIKPFFPAEGHFQYPSGKNKSTLHSQNKQARASKDNIKNRQTPLVLPVKDVPYNQALLLSETSLDIRNNLHSLIKDEKIQAALKNGQQVEYGDEATVKATYFHQHTKAKVSHTKDGKVDDETMEEQETNHSKSDGNKVTDNIFQRGMMQGLSFEGAKDAKFHIKKCTLLDDQSRTTLISYQDYIVSHLQEYFQQLEKGHQKSTHKAASLSAIQELVNFAPLDQTTDEKLQSLLREYYEKEEKVLKQKLDDERRQQVTVSKAVKNRLKRFNKRVEEVFGKGQTRDINTIQLELDDMIKKEEDTDRILEKVKIRESFQTLTKNHAKKSAELAKIDENIAQLESEMKEVEEYGKMTATQARQRFNQNPALNEHAQYVFDKKGDHRDIVVHFGLEQVERVGYGNKHGTKPSCLLAPSRANCFRAIGDTNLEQHSLEVGYWYIAPQNFSGCSIRVHYTDKNGKLVHDIWTVTYGTGLFVRSDVLIGGVFGHVGDTRIIAAIRTTKTLWCTSKKDLELVHGEIPKHQLSEIMSTYHKACTAPARLEVSDLFEYFVGRAAYSDEKDTAPTEEIKYRTGDQAIQPEDVIYAWSNWHINPNKFHHTTYLKGYKFGTEQLKKDTKPFDDKKFPVFTKRSGKIFFTVRAENIRAYLKDKYGDVPYMAHAMRIMQQHSGTSADRFRQIVDAALQMKNIEEKDLNWRDILEGERQYASTVPSFPKHVRAISKRKASEIENDDEDIEDDDDDDDEQHEHESHDMSSNQEDCDEDNEEQEEEEDDSNHNE